MRLVQHLPVRKTLLIVAGILLAGWLIPPLFHAGRYRKALEAALENQLGRPVELGSVTLRLLPHPGFSVENVLVQEDPRFGSEPFARVESVECDLRWRSLWSSRLSCSRIVLNHPVVNLVRSSSGDWNVEEIFHRQRLMPKARGTPASRSPASRLDFEVDGARLNFTLNGAKKPFALDAVRARVEFDPSHGPVSFRIQGTPVRTDLALLEPPGRVVITGGWKPQAGINGPFHARLTTNNSLLYAWIPLLAHRDPGIYGLVSADVRFEGSARQLTVKGAVRITQLHRWESLPPSSPVPVDIAVSGWWDGEHDLIKLKAIDARFSSSRLDLTGTIAQALRSPELKLALAIEQSPLEDLLRMGNCLAKHPARARVFGRVDGDITVEGPWRALRYAGVLRVRSPVLEPRGLDFQSRGAEIRIDSQGAHLAPMRLTLAPGIEGVAEGVVYPALPGSATLRRSPSPRYELLLALKQAPLHSIIRLARTWGVRGLSDLDATGTVEASIRLSGKAWPFTKPELDAQGSLDSARLLVAGLTEPLELKRFRFQIKHDAFTASPINAVIGGASFSGWLKRDARPETGWQFAARAPHLSLEQASLWFSVLGYQRPRPILDLIPGLRSLEGGRAASRNLFATIVATGSFDSPDVTFRSLTLRNFHTDITISGRVARLSGATFEAGAGLGRGSAEVDFKQAPARIHAQFQLTGLRMRRFANVLPEALSGVRGTLSVAARLTTRGLTRREMAAHLHGAAEVRCRNLNFAGFDPVEAVARAASLGSLAPEHRTSTLPALDINLIIGSKDVEVTPTRVPLSGAALDFEGRYDFNGMANFLVRADLSHLKRRWLIDAPATSPQDRIVRLELTGPLKDLTVTPVDHNHSQ